jgi:hypothetical protein
MYACTWPPATVQHPSAAPDFSYITDEQLESAMWQLAAGIKSLDAIFGNREPVTRSQRLEVIRILDQMLVAVDELGPNAVSTNHPHIASNLGRFREKLVIAHNSVEMEPPRYYLVGQFSGACRACHASE